MDRNVLFHYGHALTVEVNQDGRSQAKPWQWWKDQGMDSESVIADPQFVDPTVRDYRLQPNSPALKIGFQPIDLDPIGPFESADRASWPLVQEVLHRESPLVYPGEQHP